VPVRFPQLTNNYKNRILNAFVHRIMNIDCCAPVSAPAPAPHPLSRNPFREAPARRRRWLTLTGDAMHAVALDRPPMGSGIAPRLVRRAASLDIANNNLGRAFFTLRDAGGSVLVEVDFAPEDFQRKGARRGFA
jgi:hypothetical protein